MCATTYICRAIRTGLFTECCYYDCKGLCSLCRQWADKWEQDAKALWSILNRLEHGPPEIIQMVLELLEDEFIMALKYVGRSFWSQAVLVLQSSFKLYMTSETRRKTLPNLYRTPWLSRVRQLDVVDEDSAIPDPSHDECFGFGKLLSYLPILENASFTLFEQHQVAYTVVLSLLGARPYLKSLHVCLQEDLWYDESSTSEYEEDERPKCVESTGNQENNSTFRQLQHLSLAYLKEGAMLNWIRGHFASTHKAPKCGGNLVFINLQGCALPVSSILLLAGANASTIKDLRVNFSQNEQEEHARKEVHLPKLQRMFSSIDTARGRGDSESMDDSAAVLHLIEAPALITLGCSHLLDTHAESHLRALAEGWRRKSPSLRSVLASHQCLLRPRKAPLPEDPEVELKRLQEWQRDCEMLEDQTEKRAQIVRDILQGTLAEVHCLQWEQYAMARRG